VTVKAQAIDFVGSNAGMGADRLQSLAGVPLNAAWAAHKSRKANRGQSN
jgi:hypothetical protein